MGLFDVSSACRGKVIALKTPVARPCDVQHWPQRETDRQKQRKTDRHTERQHKKASVLDGQTDAWGERAVKNKQ